MTDDRAAFRHGTGCRPVARAHSTIDWPTRYGTLRNAKNAGTSVERQHVVASSTPSPKHHTDQAQVKLAGLFGQQEQEGRRPFIGQPQIDGATCHSREFAGYADPDGRRRYRRKDGGEKQVRQPGVLPKPKARCSRQSECESGGQNQGPDPEARDESSKGIYHEDLLVSMPDHS